MYGSVSGGWFHAGTNARTTSTTTPAIQMGEVQMLNAMIMGLSNSANGMLRTVVKYHTIHFRFYNCTQEHARTARGQGTVLIQKIMIAAHIH